MRVATGPANAEGARRRFVYPAAPMWKKKPTNDFRPTTPRQRRIILAAALAVFVVMWVLLIWEPGNDPATRYPQLNAPSRDRPACAPGQTTGCVGGQANVILLPASPSTAPDAAPALQPGPHGGSAPGR